MSIFDWIVNPFNRKPGYTFRDFIWGGGHDHLCTTCNTYVHRDNYTHNLKICDDCGILNTLRNELKKATDSNH